MRMTRKSFLAQSAALMAPSLAFSAAQQGLRAHSGEAGSIFNVATYGAKGDGVTKDTMPIQAAIDAAAKAGGTVCLPPGKYRSGTLHLKSLVSFYLSPGATLLASPDAGDFDPYEKLDYETGSDEETTYFHSALLLGEEVHNVAIGGHGTIDGNRVRRGGPKPIALKRCREVQIRDVTLKNAPNYTISMLGCKYVDIEGVTIFNGYADGIDPDCSQNVRIANCYIETWDDCVCPKTSYGLGERRSTENVTVTNCVLSTASDALKLGTESSGDFKNIAFTNCTVFAQPEKWKKYPTTGVAIESVDGANVDRVVVSNIAMEDVNAPLFIRLGNRGRAQNVPTPGTLQNVSISNITATGARLASSISGIPGHPVKRVTLSHIRVSAVGGGKAEWAGRKIPELVASYPEANMFGDLPALGLFCRQADGLTLDHLEFIAENPDPRPVLIAEHVDDLDVSSLRASPTSGSEPVVLLRNVSRALVQGTRAMEGTAVFLRLTGEQSGKVHALGNDLSDAMAGFDIGKEVREGMFVEIGNLLPRAHCG